MRLIRYHVVRVDGAAVNLLGRDGGSVRLLATTPQEINRPGRLSQFQQGGRPTALVMDAPRQVSDIALSDP